MTELHRDIAEIRPHRTGNHRPLRNLFIALGPISLVGYLLVHAWLNLAGACYNLVVESSLEPLLGRPIHLPNWAIYALSPLIVLVAPVAALVHAAIGLGRAARSAMVRVGRWQTGMASAWTAGLCGLLWTVLLVWVVVACIDPQTGWRLLGREIPGLREYTIARYTQTTLGGLPAEMQARRQFLMSDTPAASEVRAQLSPYYADELVRALAVDEALLADFRLAIQKHIAGLPWYYELVSEVGPVTGRAGLLLGPLLFALMLMIRWPGTGFLAPGGAVSLVPFLGRVVLGVGVVAAAVLGNRRDVAELAGPAGLVLVAALLVALVYWLTWKASTYWRLPRQYSPFLAMRLLQRKRIAFFSLGAVTLCVAMVLIVISVMGGFLDMVRERSHSLLGDLILENGMPTGFPMYKEFIDEILTWPEVAAATPVIHTGGIMNLPGQDRTFLVKIAGIRLDTQMQVTPFKDALFYEKWYPGTTTLGRQGQPLYSLTREGLAVLPPPLEEALAGSEAWKQLQADPGMRMLYTRVPWAAFPGPGKYELLPIPEDERLDPERPPRPIWQGPELPGIIIGRDLVAIRTDSGEYDRILSPPRGARVIVYVLPLSRKGGTPLMGGAATRTLPFRYTDDSRTGVYEIDSEFVYVDFDVLQEALEMGAGQSTEGTPIRPRASQVLIRLRPGYDIYEVRARLNEAWFALAGQVHDPFDLHLMSAARIFTWEEEQRVFISAVEKEKVLMLILFGVISLVAIFLILCIFYMIVLEKTRDIGILKSIGGSAGGVAGVFLSYGAAIGVVGAALGLLLGTLFVRNINQIQDWLASLHPELRVWKADVYSFDHIPSVVKFEDAAVIAAVAVLASIVGALVPAMIAARRHPVESLRYE